ncbi:MAG: ATP-binding cassette domain-containing protein [Anaerolineae bacterium]
MSRRVITPTLLQSEAIESGAAALGIVLRYYGNHTPIEELRYACAVSQDGSSLGNLIQAAQFYGLEADWVQSTIPDLRRLPVPQILPWQSDQFLVLEGFGGRSVYVNDPADGRRVMSRREFEDGYGGAAVVLKPTEKFQPARQPFEVKRALGEHLRGTRGAITYFVIISLFLLVPGILLPSFLRVFVDDILIAGQNWITALLVGMGIAALFGALLTWLQRMSLLRLEIHVAARSAAELFWHVLHLPIPIAAQRTGSDFADHVESGERAARLIFGAPAVVVANVLLSVFFALVMLQYSVILTAISILFAVFSLVIYSFVTRRQRENARDLLHARGRLASALMDGLRALESFKATASERLLFERWTTLHGRVVADEQALGSATNLLEAVSVFLTGMNAAILLIGGGALVMQGSMSIGVLVAFQSLLFSFSQPVGQLLSLSGRLQEAEGNLQRADDVFANPTIAELDESDSPGVLTGNLELRTISFGYNPLQPPFIDRQSLTIRPGQRVALVGAPGSGRTTIARLIAGLYPTWEGQILFDGQDRAAYPQAVMSRSVAMVGEQPALFTGTVQENLTLWNEYAALTDLWRAAKDACIHETILKRPDGYNHLIDEGGRNFSAGERQCLEIARALVSNPTLLILDEATSALDPITETKLLANLGWRGCACLVISQRLAAIRDFDEIVVMDAGALVERGTHADLIARDGLYARMVAAEVQASEAAASPYSRLIPAWLRQSVARAPGIRSSAAAHPLPTPPSDLSGLLRFALGAARIDTLILILAGLIGGLLGLALPLLTAAVVENAVATGELRLLQTVGYALALAALGLAVFRWFRGAAALHVQARLDSQLQPAIWQQLIRLPASVLRPYTSGDLADRALSLDALKRAVADLAALSPLTAVFSAMSFGLLLYYDVPMALLAAALVAGSLLLTFGLSGFGAQFERLRAELKGETSGLVLQMLDGLTKLRAAGAENRALVVWARLFEWQQRLRYKAQRAQSLAHLFVGAYPVIASMVVFALVYARGTLSLSEFVGFNLAFAQLGVAAASLSRAIILLRHAAPTYARVQPLVQAAPENGAGRRAPDEIAGAVTVRSVSFRYADDQPLVVSDLSFHVDPGEFVAIVGASGAGKSTLLRLLLGFERPAAGEIFYDDQPLSSLNTDGLRQQVATVLHDSPLIDGDVLTNISGGRDLAPETVWQAAQLAGIADDIRRMPMGLSTSIGRSSALTTGQRQRLLIARALAAQPRILLLDDALTALDDRAQTQLMSALRRIDATRIVVASRLNTVAAADRILIMHAGRIAESGTYAGLVQAGGRFAALAQPQSR